MPTPLRMRTQMLLGFLSLFTVLTLVMGYLAWLWVDKNLREQAEQRARSIGRVITSGGFALNDRVREKMQTLTGYEFHMGADGQQEAGSLTITENGVTVTVNYQTAAYHAERQKIITGTIALVFSGVLLCLALSFWLARRLALPLEALSLATRRIGEGELETPVQDQPASGAAEICLLTRDVERMRGRLIELDAQHRQDERLATLGLFTATIAHEVRNPLSAVRLTVQMLERQYADATGLTMIQEELERLDLTVDELLSFSRGIEIERVDSDLTAIAKDVCRLLKRQADYADVLLTIEGEAQCAVDPKRVRQLLMNIILNAIQAQHEDGGEVIISVCNNGYTIRDKGPGVPQGIQAHLFEPFTTAKESGTGLGLHLAKEIATAHGGSLSYADAPEGGALFTVLFS